MSSNDPFFTVKDEVLKSLIRTRNLFEHWKGYWSHDENSPRTVPSEVTDQLINSIRSLEWDIEDLDDAVMLIERPNGIKLDPTEVTVRKEFVDRTRNEINLLKQIVQMDIQESTGLKKMSNFSSAKIAQKTKAFEKMSLMSSMNTTLGNNSGYIRLPEVDLNEEYAENVRHKLLLKSETENAILHSVVLQLEDGELREPNTVAELEAEAQFGAEILSAESKLDARMHNVKILNISKDRKRWAGLVSFFFSVAFLVVICVCFF